MASEPPSEIDVLRQELAALRAQVLLLQRVVQINTNEQGTPEFVNISCHRLGLMNPDSWGDGCGQLLATEEGGTLALWKPGANVGKEKILMNFESGAPAMVLTGTDGCPVAEVSSREEGGYAMVHSPGGVPRAFMKAKLDGGVFTLAAPDGKARGAFLSTETDVELMILGEDSKPVAQLLSTADGGLLRLNNHAGELRAVLGSVGGSGEIKNAGTLLIHGGNTQAVITAAENEAVFDLGERDLSGTPETNQSRVQLAIRGAHAEWKMTGQEDRGMSACVSEGQTSLHFFEGASQPIRLFAFKDIRTLQFEGPTGNLAVSVMANEGGSSVALNYPKDGPALLLATTEKEASLGLTDSLNYDPLAVLKAESGGGIVGVRTQAQSSRYTHLSAFPAGSALEITDAEDIPQVAMRTSPDGGSLAIRNELGVERAVMGIAKDGGALKLNWGGTPAVLAAATDRGGMFLVHDEAGGIRAALPDQDELPDGED